MKHTSSSSKPGNLNTALRVHRGSMDPRMYSLKNTLYRRIVSRQPKVKINRAINYGLRLLL